MLLEFLQSYVGADAAYRPGDRAEFKGKLAASLLAGGACRRVTRQSPVETVVAAPAPERAIAVAKSAGRGRRIVNAVKGLF